MSLKDGSGEDTDGTTMERFQNLSISHDLLDMEEKFMGTKERMTMEQQLQHARELRVYGEKLLRDYRISKKLEDIDNSVKAYGQAVRFAGEDSQQPHLKYDYTIALLERFNFQKDLIDIDMAISILQSALDAIPDESKEITNWSGFLSSLHYMRYEASDDMAYLSHSIDALRTSVQSNPGDGRLPSSLNNISVFLRQRFQRSDHNLIDISEAISFRQRLVSIKPHDNNVPSWLEVLAMYFEDRFRFGGELNDLSEAILALSKALDLCPGHDTDFIRRLGRRGLLYRQRSEHGGGINDILNAVNDHEEALRITPDDYSDLYELLGNLGSSYLCMYGQTEDPDHIAEALASLQYATQLIPSGNPDAPPFWSNLGSAFYRRFEYTLDPQDISSAISAQQQSIQLASENDSRFPSLLNNLAQSYQARFDIAGDLLDVSEAISVQRKSINLTSESHVNMHKYLSNLGIALQCRAERTRDIKDISEAIDAHRRAVELCRSEDSSLMPVYLSNLGDSLSARFNMDKNSKDFDDVTDSKDINEAILFYRRALNLSRKDDTISVAGHHVGLCLALTKRFKLNKSSADIDDAVHSAETALDLCRQDRSVDLISRLNTLATVLSVRFKHSRNISDITRAISVQNRAIELLPPGHPFLSAQYFNAGDSLEMRFGINNNLSDIETATSRFKEAASSASAPPFVRLNAAKSWAGAAKLLDTSGNSCMEAYKMAISLLSQVAGMEKTIGLRHRNLIQISDISNEAAASAFASNNLQYALEWLEQGRCIVWNQLHNLHTPFDNLSDYDPELANSLSKVARDLDAVGLRDEGSPSGLDPTAMIKKMALQDEATKHIRLAQEWDTLLAKARSITGFENFLQPAKYDDLVGQSPDEGYVVVVNMHPDRCDAIVIRGAEKDTIHIPLISFTYDGAVHLVKLLDSILDPNRSRNESTLETDEEARGSRPYLGSSNLMQTILADLWLGVVDPILHALGILRKDSGELTRVWWCPTGPLCFLPIHAAGIYNGTKNICLSDFVVSSYIPSVSTLVHSMGTSRSPQRITEYPEVAIIAQEDAPGLPPLPGVKKEVEILQQRFNSATVKFSCLQGSNATMERTLAEMESHNFVHLACHAVQDLSHPLKSGFHLSDGRLELWTMLKIHNRNAEFAFLSACQTARGNSWLWEEVVHLGAGMLAVGYRGVVSTLWSIQDRYGMKIADQFYSRLFDREDINGGEGNYGTAGALHYAVKRLRAEVGDSPTGMLAWVPYVHMGV